MATDFTRPQEVLELHTEMVEKLGELFLVNGTKWHIILDKVQMLNLLPVADVEEIKTMYNLFIRLVKKKDNGITYGEYTRIRTILGSCNVDAEEIIDYYTGRIHAFYKDVPTVEINTESYSVKKGQNVVLKCELIKSTTSIVDVQWKRKANGKDTFTDIEIDDKRYIGGSLKSPSLCITETREEDNEAIYVCQVKNAAGTGKSDEIRVKITQPEQETNATYTDPEKTFDGLWKNAMEEADAITEIFIKPFGKLKDNLATFLALQPETSHRDSQESHDNVFVSAATVGQTEIVKQLLEKGIDHYDPGALESAAGGGHTDAVEQLMEMGADSNQVAKEMTFTSGKDQLTSSKCEEADVEPLYEDNRVTDVVPLGEKEFPTRLTYGKNNFIDIDVREGYFEYGGYDTSPSYFRHEKLKMGCRIGVMNQQVQNSAGTLGPFVRYNGNTSFLTCAHVLFDVARQGTVDFTYDGSNRIDVVQPALDTSITSGAACGFIQRAIFNPRMNPSIDMAVVTISDASRLPTKGRFANEHRYKYRTAGFNELPEYNNGSRVLHFQETGTSNMVVQFGSETHLSKGYLAVDGTHVRPLSTVLGLPLSKDPFCMSGQYEVEGLRQNLFLPGDSGAAVFMVNGTSLHCIGMAIGRTSTGNAVVTPIAALLDAVARNTDIDLSVFP